MKLTTAIALSLLMLSGCKSAEEQCNEARVQAFDAWTAVDQQLAPQCGLFHDHFWESISQRGLDAVGAMAAGVGGDFEAMEIEREVEGYRGELVDACRATRRAKASANQGALAARESSDQARAAVLAVLTDLPNVIQALRGDGHVRPERAEAIRRIQAHSDALAPAELTSRLSVTATTSPASWSACQTVQP